MRACDIEDERLVRLARQAPGSAESREAASALLAKYQERVYRWCYRQLRDHETALDVAQEVLLRAYRELHGYEGRAEFASWLFVIARNCCRSSYRREAARPSRSETDPEEIAGNSGDPERILAERGGEAALLDLVRRVLDPVEQEALWMRCVDRLSVESITDLLGLRGASGARAVLQRARRKLRSALGEGERGDSPEGVES